MSGHRMEDPYGDIKAGIDALHPPADADDSSIDGRMASLDHDTHLVYSEMYDLLTAGPPDGDTREWEQQLHDLAGVLVALHEHTEQVFERQLAGRWGW